MSPVVKDGAAVEPIAIIGLSCRFPDANNETEFWELLREGRDATKPAPVSRTLLSGGASADWQANEGAEVHVNNNPRPAGYLKTAIDEFDAKFFHISRREAEYMDPQQRLLLEGSWESLENAGIDPSSLQGSNTSVYVGIWSQEYDMSMRLAQSNHGSMQTPAQGQSLHYRYLGNAFCAAPARISHFLGLRGPSIAMDASCASSLEAIHYGCEALRSGDTDLCISGGVNVTLRTGAGSSSFAGLDSFILSKDGKCKTFDKDADGFARGEACVVLVLKRYEDAVRDGNEVLGLLVGSAVVSDGAGMSMGTPNGEAQAQVIRKALSKAGVSPHDVQYVEAHGTGTPVGDPIEFGALNNVFGQDPLRTAPLYIGSVKTNIGHSEGASGAAGLVKVLLAMRYSLIPKHLNLSTLSPSIDLGQIPAVIPMTNTAWSRSSQGLDRRPRLAGVSSFGLSGTNVHVIVQEPPPQVVRPPTPPPCCPGLEDQSHHILVLSAASEPALNALVDSYKTLLQETAATVPFVDIAHSANTSRALHLPYRLAVLAENSQQALARLTSGHVMSSKAQNGSDDLKQARTIGFIFTGQGSQYVGMAKELYVSSPVFRAWFDKCAWLLINNYDLDLACMLSYSNSSMPCKGKYQSTQSLDESNMAQPALFCIEVCLARLWQSFGIEPDFVLGHSVGEFAAAVVAGLLSLEDGLKLVVERSRLVSSRTARGAMLVVKSGLETVKKMIDRFNKETSKGSHWIDIAAVNSKEEVVVSGPHESIALFENIFSCIGGPGAAGHGHVHTQRLSSSHAFHSRAMEPILEEYERVAATVTVTAKEPKQGSKGPTFISGTRAKIMIGDELISSYWTSHLREPVNFVDAFSLLQREQCCSAYVEIGPQPVLLGLGMSSLPIEEAMASSCVWAPSIRKNESNWVTMLTSVGKLCLAGLKIDWGRRTTKTKVSRGLLPNYPFQRERYWHSSSSGSATSAVECLQINAKLLHPLLGRRVPSARPDLVLYHNAIRLSETGSLAWMHQHKVADVVTLPAAAYLELALAAGGDLIGGIGAGNILLYVEDLLVERALTWMGDGEDCVAQIQTSINVEAVQCNEEEDQQKVKYTITIHKQTMFDSGSGSDAGTWRKLASATFLPCQSIDSSLIRAVDLNSLRATLTSCSREAFDKAYTKLHDIGLTFGPLFKSARRAWTSDALILIEAEFPAAINDNYVYHPAVLDAMLQASVFGPCCCDSNSDFDSSSGIHLPVSVQKLVSLARGTWTKSLFMLMERPSAPQHAVSSSSLIVATRVTLYNEAGEFMAMLDMPEFVHTSVDSFLRSLGAADETSCHPPFYEEVWVKKLGSCANRFEIPGAESWTNHQEYAREVLDELQEALFIDVTARVSKLAYLYILRAVRELGSWGTTAEGNLISLSNFVVQAEIHPRHGQLFRRMLQIIQEEDGSLAFEDEHVQNATMVRILRPFPGMEELEIRIQTCIANMPEGDARSIDCQYIMDFGERLPALLQDKMSPSLLLFPDRHSGSIGAAGFYKGVTISTVVMQAAKRLSAIVRKIQSQTRSNGAVLRVLEIGAGTGNGTEYFLHELNQSGIQYEYTFTDISPFFLKLASEKFASHSHVNKNLHFQVLDIEQDPKGQGYVPHYFDIILADMVIHATRDLHEALGNVRHLLVPHGILLLIEQVIRSPILDITFGFMDGWWRFKDYQLRKDHACISTEQWSRVLCGSGFCCTGLGGIWKMPQGLDVIVATADEQIATRPVLGRTDDMSGGALWLICGQQDSVLANSLKNRFESVGEKVLVVSQEEEYSLYLESGTGTIRVHEAEDYITLIRELSSSNNEVKVQLKGIIHLWAVDATCASTDQQDDAILSKLVNGLLYLVQAMLPLNNNNCNIHLVTAGVQSVDQNLDPINVNPLASILQGIVTTVNNELLGDGGSGTQLVCIDIDDVQPESHTHVSKEIFDQIWQLRVDNELQVAFRDDGSKYVQRLARRPPYIPSITLPKTDRYKLQGSITDFTIVPAMKGQLETGQVEVAVHAVSLNFKDVLVALNNAATKNNDTTNKLVQDFGSELGLDFAGIVTRTHLTSSSTTKRFQVGDRVYGVATGGGSLASHVIIPETNISQIPSQQMSFECAAGLGAVVLTVYYFLKERAQLQAGDKILIHCATGGVGLLAIWASQAVGATVYATAGSVRKRNYLKRFMGVEYVYSSRDTQFGGQVLTDTEGCGVDVVLNALTGPGFKEASLAACARNANARFLEMSKINVWSPQEVRELRPDVTYVTMDVSSLTLPTASASTSISKVASDKFLRNVFAFGRELMAGKELPITRFPLSRVHDAFRYLQTAKHIGKVVVRMPTTTIGLQDGRIVHKEQLFNEYGSYLITGGLGGIGFEVAKWMAGSGAKYLVLVGRRPPSAYTGLEYKLEQLKAGISGLELLILQVDVSDYEQCGRLLVEMDRVGFPPLKGIMHAAAAFSYHEISKETTQFIMSVLKPKVHGTWNLHKLTLAHNLVLDHFILFSSVTAITGGFGQSGYGGANRYMDTFAAYRSSLGLPCTSIAWGPWSEVGEAVGFTRSLERVLGLKNFSVSHGIGTLQRIMLEHKHRVIAAEIGDWNLVTQRYQQGNLFELVKTTSGTLANSGNMLAWYEHKIKEIHATTAIEAQFEVVKEFLEYALRDTLKFSNTDVIDHDADLRSLGIDSLLAMELRGKLHGLIKGPSSAAETPAVNEPAFTLQSFNDNRTINKLAKLITEVLNGGAGVGRQLSAEQLLQLVKQDCVLPDDIVMCPDQAADSPANFRHILLTGATGQLGVFLLHELVTRRPDLRLTCLIRADSSEAALGRLESALNNFDLLDSTELDNVTCLAGSVTQDQFGLTPEVYSELALDVDAVIHSAALCHHGLAYGEYGPDDIRSTNVLGLVNVLRFAVAHGKTKWVQHQSSIGAALCEGDENPLESFPGDECWGEPLYQNGYVLSKFVGEKLCKSALDHDTKFPLVVVRHHYLSADTQSGILTIRNNNYTLATLASRRVGLFPDFGMGLTMVPVNISASVSISLFLNAGIQPGLYTINNPYVTYMADLMEYFGTTCPAGQQGQQQREYKIVPYEQWREAVLETHTTELAPLVDVYIKGLISSELFEKSSLVARLRARDTVPPLPNSNKLKAFVPNVDELMQHPMDLIKLYVANFEAMFGGPEHLNEFLEAQSKKSYMLKA